MHNELSISKIGERNGRALWRLNSNFRYYSVHLRPWLGDDTLYVPAGFVTDLASVPRFLLSITGEVAQEASVPHDYLYQMRGMFQDKDEMPVPRYIADYVFHEAMGLYGPQDWRRPIMYRAVRMGGWKAWSTYGSRIETLNKEL